jgi:protein TonB
MLAYAAHRRPRRQLSPSALALILGGHALAIVLVASAKMDLPILDRVKRTEVVAVELPPENKPEPPRPKPKEDSRTQLPPLPNSFLDRPPPTVLLPQSGPVVDIGPALGSELPNIGTALETPIQQTVEADPPPPVAEPVRVAARALTPPDLLRPPYPESKLRSEEQAVLRLRLAIDARGRVTAVEPVGDVDPAFLAAARSHLIRHWRYRPATEDGRAVATSLTITLRFELED